MLNKSQNQNSPSHYSVYRAQANEALRRNETVASVLQLQAETRCSNTKKAYDQRQSKITVHHTHELCESLSNRRLL